MKTSKVWFVTGASHGLGLFPVKKLLVNGYRVAATSRNIVGLKEAVGINDADIFLPLSLDLSKSDAIDAVFEVMTEELEAIMSILYQRDVLKLFILMTIRKCLSCSLLCPAGGPQT